MHIETLNEVMKNLRETKSRNVFWELKEWFSSIWRSSFHKESNIRQGDEDVSEEKRSDDYIKFDCDHLRAFAMNSMNSMNSMNDNDLSL
jgi:hypothetical protein